MKVGNYPASWQHTTKNWLLRWSHDQAVLIWTCVSFSLGVLWEYPPISSELQDFVPQFSHCTALLSPCPSFYFSPVFHFLSTDGCSPKHFLSCSSFALLPLLPLVYPPSLLPTVSFIFTPSVSFSSSLSLSFYLALSLLLAVLAMLVARALWFHLPFFSLCGANERSCNKSERQCND